MSPAAVPAVAVPACARSSVVTTAAEMAGSAAAAAAAASGGYDGCGSSKHPWKAAVAGAGN